MAHVMRAKCQILIAYGACAHMGGIPGLANVTTKEAILDKVYDTTLTTINPEGNRPQETSKTDSGHELTLPNFWEEVKALDDIVDVDYYVPACPPTTDMNMQILGVVKDFVTEGKPLPPKGTVIASVKTLCDECARDRAEKVEIDTLYRIHEIEFDEKKCFLEQGVICLGPATRAGCGAVCTETNMPCRGCMGPTAAVTEQGASMLSALASVYGLTDREHEMSEDEIDKLMGGILDPLGCFYRFSLPKSQLGRVVKDVAEVEE
jgi:F420-non-reducing hydrogenase small subunit